MSDNQKMSQEIEVRKPLKGEAYPISISDWDFLKLKIGDIKIGLNLFETVGFLLLGAGLSLLTSMFLDYPDNIRKESVCWSAFIILIIVGISFVLFGVRRNKDFQQMPRNIVKDMEHIESKFEYVVDEEQMQLNNKISTEILPMKEAIQKDRISYLHWDYLQFEVSIVDLKYDLVLLGYDKARAVNVVNPKFRHHHTDGHGNLNGNAHDSPNINYLSDDGLECTAYCKCLVDENRVSFYFDVKEGSKPFQKKQNIRILDWNKEKWEVTIDPIYLRFDEEPLLRFACNKII